METETAECRGCRIKLNGKPYYMGGRAYHPKTKEQARVNYYGGFVCSERCDFKVCIDMESSMPGAGLATILSSGAKNKIKSNWG